MEKFLGNKIVIWISWVIIFFLFAFFLFSVVDVDAASKKVNWSVYGTLENEKGNFYMVNYQKIYDADFKVVCYSAKAGNSVSISCVNYK